MKKRETTHSWFATGLWPFLPLIPSAAQRVIVIGSASGRCKIGVWQKSSVAADYLALMTSDSLTFPHSMNWVTHAPGEPVALPTGREQRSCLIVLPEALEGMKRREARRQLRGFLREMSASDTMLVGSRNRIPFLHGAGGALSTGQSPRMLLSVAVWFFLRTGTSDPHSFVCLGRDSGETLRLISTGYRMQRAYVRRMSYDVTGVRRLRYWLVSTLGIYPWLEREHIFAVTKC